MAELIKTISGTIYSNEFDSELLDPVLIVSPGDGYYSLSDVVDHLTINGTNGNIKILINPIVTEYVILAKVNYTPVDSSTGGLILYKDENTFIKLESFNSNTVDLGKVYSYLKIVRVGALVTLYGSTNGLVWKLIGQFSIGDIHLLVGLFAEGTQNFNVDSINIFKGEELAITNLDPTYQVKIFDETGLEILYEGTPDENGICTITLNTPVMGSLKVFTLGGVLISSTEITSIVGGDEYQLELSVELYIQDPETLEYSLLDPLSTTNLGLFESITIDRKMFVRNIDDSVINNIEVSIKPNNVSLKGYKSAELTEIVNDVPGETYTKLIQDIAIEPNEIYKFNLRVNRDGTTLSSSDYSFNINVRAW